MSVTQGTRAWADRTQAKMEGAAAGVAGTDPTADWNEIIPETRLIGGAMITLVLVAVVLNEILTTNATNISNGPFSSFVNDLEQTGVAAMGLLVVGLLVVAANAILGRFGS